MTPLKTILRVVLPLLLFVGCCIVPAMPEFFADQQRNKQQECRQVLSEVLARYLSLDGGVPLKELAAAVPGARRRPYTYVLGDGVTVPPLKDAPAEAERARQLAHVQQLAQPGLRGTQLTVACVGNTDDDEQLDVLSISSADRFGWGDSKVAAGEPYLHESDFNRDPGQVVRFEATDGG